MKLKYISIDTILSKFYRDLRDTDVSESDIIEWAGEALGFMKIVELQEEAVAFLEVKNHTAEVPKNFQYVIQLAKHNKLMSLQNEEDCKLLLETVCCDKKEEKPVKADCNKGQVNGQVYEDCDGNLLNSVEPVYYRPYYDLKYEYSMWFDSSFYNEKFTPIRLSNNSFFNTVVAELKTDIYKPHYEEEYTVINTFPDIALRFSFKDGVVALAYVRTALDCETGYPLIPDEANLISAISYYIKWKLSERLRWSGREGFEREAADSERLWKKYLRQGLNTAKMPHGVDDYQDLMEDSLYLIPKHRKYYGYFGKLGKEELRLFNRPNRFRRTFL